MKRIVCILLLIIAVSVAAFAEEYPSFYGENELSRAYSYDEWDSVVLQDGDLDAENLCQTVFAIIKDSVGEADSIEEVSLANGVLNIIVNWPASAPDPFTNGQYAQERAASITDEILNYSELDECWNEITLSFPEARARFTPDMIEDEGNGRFFNYDEIISQIPD